MNASFGPKKRRPVVVMMNVEPAAPKPASAKKLDRFHKKHGKHGVSQTKLAGGSKTMHKCHGCKKAHFEHHA
jgi:hypothetical protein